MSAEPEHPKQPSTPSNHRPDRRTATHDACRDLTEVLRRAADVIRTHDLAWQACPRVSLSHPDSEQARNRRFGSGRDRSRRRRSCRRPAAPRRLPLRLGSPRAKRKRSRDATAPRNTVPFRHGCGCRCWGWQLDHRQPTSFAGTCAAAPRNVVSRIWVDPGSDALSQTTGAGPNPS